MTWDDHDPFGDFDSDDPFERYSAHQRAKGRAPMPDPDLVRKAQKERPPDEPCTCGGRGICTSCALREFEAGQ